MADSAAPIVELGTKLCPWLQEPLDRLEAARASGRLGHGWLLKGPAGIGKLNLALVFAHRLLGTVRAADPLPVLEAAAAAEAMKARHLPADHHPDLHWLFPEEDKRTISVDQVRAVAQALSLKGFGGVAKVVVVEPAEAMTAAAANALLKTLEEPAESTYLLLIAHQPDRLLPTIRSRCQSLVLSPPPADAVLEWLGLADDPRRDPIMLMSGRAPLRALELMSGETLNFLSELENRVNLVSRKKVDARSVAEEWVKHDLELALQWLIRRLQESIRSRVAPRDSKGVTDLAADPLHNAWLVLPVRALFERLQAAEKLLNQVGSGINSELALHVLLLGFQPNRGRT